MIMIMFIWLTSGYNGNEADVDEESQRCEGVRRKKLCYTPRFVSKGDKRTFHNSLVLSDGEEGMPPGLPEWMSKRTSEWINGWYMDGFI